MTRATRGTRERLVRHRTEAERRQELLDELAKIDRQLATSKDCGRSEAFDAIVALMIYADVDEGASSTLLRLIESFEDTHRGIVSRMWAIASHDRTRSHETARLEFEGQLAGLIEVVADELGTDGAPNYQEAYSAKNSASRTVVEVAAAYAAAHGWPMTVRNIHRSVVRDWLDGTGAASPRRGRGRKGERRVVDRVKFEPEFDYWQQHASCTLERWFALLMIERAREVRDRKDDVLAWCAEEARRMWDVTTVPPSSA